MKTVIAALALAVLCCPALAEENALDIPCDGLPATAVKTVPAPFDTYLDLVCTKGGQAIKAKPGFRLQFEQGAFYLNAINPARPGDISRTAHYTALTDSPLNADEARTLRADLHSIADNPMIDTATILRLRIETSTEAKKQVYLLVPANGGHVLGMECATDCQPITKDPWFFTIIPDAVQKAS